MDSNINDALRRFDINTVDEAKAFLELYYSAVNKWWYDFIRVNYDLMAADLGKISTNDSMEKIGKVALSFAAKRNVLVGLLSYVDSMKTRADEILKTEGGE